MRNLDELRGLEPLIEDAGFREDWRAIKRANKAALAAIIRERTGVVVNPEAIFDVQVKRIHEYKRQHLNILHVIGLYRRLKTDPTLEIQPRVFIFGGKAAPGYQLAKLMIRLITAVGEIINRDPGVRDLLKVVFLPNFNVTNAQRIYPAADLSEQISTAGKEASGTGNMKFQMNGALTIGTLDGANIEIREEVGAENFFLFGMNAQQVQWLRQSGYRPMDLYRSQPELREVIDIIRDGFFSRGNSEQFRDLVGNLCITILTWCWRTIAPMPSASARSMRPSATMSAGRACPFSIPRARASFPRTAPSASTASRSGTRGKSRCS